MLNKVVVFDLEDTLYKEINFLKSGFRAIADFLGNTYGHNNLYEDMMGAYWAGEKDVFQKIIDENHLNVEKLELIGLYRYHIPQIRMDGKTKKVLAQLQTKYHLALITDGRVKTKENIINALGLPKFIGWSDIYISEDVGHLKTSSFSFQKIMQTYPNCQYVYVGDNPAKDFLAPNKLGWMTVCLLDNGQNIHKQDFTLPVDYLPQKTIREISELVDIIE